MAASPRSGTAIPGIVAATAPANANPAAECPDGKDVDVGIGTQRCSGTPAVSRSGRARPLANFIGRFTTAELMPMAATPVSAARRPLRPPSTNNAPAAPSQSFE